MTSPVQTVIAPDSAGRLLSIPELLHERAERSADAPFVTHLKHTVTFGEMAVRAQRAANALAELGLRRGDKLAVMLPNCLEFLDLWLGAAQMGAILVPVNTALRSDGLRFVLEHSDASVVVADDTLHDHVSVALAGARRPPRVLPRLGGEDAWTAAHAAAATTAAMGDPDDGDALASILYTSGTTGMPKGVVNSHAAYLRAGHEFAANTVQVRSDDVLYTTLPLFHINAQALTTMGALVSGRPMVLAPRFSASGFLDDVRAHGATIFNYIGAMLTMIAKQPARDDDADNPIRTAVGGAAPVNLWTAFERRFGLRIQEIYGLTETACVALANPPDDIRVGQVGVPVSWSQVRIENPEGHPAPDGTPGEICIRAEVPSVMMTGYYKNPAATVEAMRGGWFHSGDRGVIDGDGYVTFIDRLKDSIRRRGENISSYEVEQAANAHPAVAESAAVGVASELGEEDVMIVVTVRPGEVLEPEDLVAHCADRIAAFMVPRYVKIVDALPKTATERVRKFLLRDDGAAGAWDREAAG